MRSLFFASIVWIWSSRPAKCWLSSSSSSSKKRPAFSATVSPSHATRWTTASNNLFLRATPVIDADFERIQERNKTDEMARTGEKEEQQPFGSKSLFQLALEADPDWNETRIPFMDGENFIDVKLAFMAELDGVQYGIGIPFDHVAAVTIERSGSNNNNNNKHRDNNDEQQQQQVIHLSPDDPESEEMIQIMAGQLQEHVGKDLSLKQTPRVLTIKGPLEKYTADWRETLVPQPLETKALLDDGDEDLDFFFEFMRKELGDEEFAKTMQESPTDIDDEILKLFDGVPSSSPKTVEDLFSNLQDEDGEDLFINEMQDFVNQKISHDGVALKLLSYSLKDGKYSVVHPLQPVALVAKYTDNDDDIRFDLLSPEEADLLIPRLEDSCLEDLQKAGLSGDSIVSKSK